MTITRKSAGKDYRAMDRATKNQSDSVEPDISAHDRQQMLDQMSAHMERAQRSVDALDRAGKVTEADLRKQVCL